MVAIKNVPASPISSQVQLRSRGLPTLQREVVQEWTGIFQVIKGYRNIMLGKCVRRICDLPCPLFIFPSFFCSLDTANEVDMIGRNIPSMDEQLFA